MGNWHQFSGIFGELDSLKSSAQTIFINGDIYIDSENKVQNIFIENDQVKAHDVDVSAFPNANVVDLKGKAIFPGFMDTHCHLLETGFVLNVGVNLREVKNSTSEIASKLRDKIAESQKGETILGVGFEMDDYTKWSLKDLAMIDAVSPDNPVMLVDMSGHNLLLNTAGMRFCNITDENFKDNIGGSSNRENGHLTGMFREKSQQKPADEIFAKFGHEDLAKEGARKLIDYWASMGYTSIVDLMGAIGFRLHKPDIFYALEKENRLKMRVNWCYTLFDVDGVDEAALLKGKDTDLVRFYGGKIFVDGAYAGGEPWTTWEHSNGGFGLQQVYTDDSVGEKYNLNRIVLRAEELSLNMHYHTQGDRAIQAVLDALEYTKNKLGSIKQTHTLAHVAFLTPEQMKLIANYGGRVVVTVQPAFCKIEDNLTQFFAGHTNEAYQIKKMFDSGVTVGMSTDFSVSPIDMVSPAVIMGVGMSGAGNPEVYQSLSMDEMIRGFTELNSKVCAHSDVGDLHVGKKADFLVVDKSFYGLTAKELQNSPPKTLETWVSGVKRF
ncbi:MAG: hypothetical protein B7Y05_03610 [Polynucleobacter sp. 24-46-87]|jgi:predicted amidohydrolase YtcJ|nr:MAG: hypothetical protein B7Y55_00315 [Polynucleobacter sp. 35-46-207]OYZ38987.1 MAG: hypothetical protein B7Y22_00430 [Polynucleobacter sp. 16-46-70]OZA15512.1 MAG: hypothetical protein B7Y05_03610 [Polynucleobacter sp. 24-46-87]OZA42043.1 MAG: hypothetical protein B7X83_00535 [Polynucleobacter sp. 17-46-58]OZB49505.1 MAG: hypothetical protein B7X60_00990 [Polynucleobacter sp. 39-45-136]HQR84474.1 amidohydrolase family protein [Polynucleobacter sp.]